MIKVIFVDVDNTLLDFDKSSRIAMEETFRQFDITYDESIFSIFKEVNDRLWQQIEDNLITKEELWNIRFNLVFDKSGIDYKDGALFDTKYRDNLQNSAVPVDGAEETLSYLSQRYTVCVTSNSFRQDMQVSRLEKAGLLKYINKVFTSEIIGYEKPDKAFFEECIKCLDGIAPNEVMLIGDSITADIIGGINYGLKTCWFNFYNEAISNNIKPDFIINKLTDIKNIL